MQTKQMIVVGVVVVVVGVGGFLVGRSTAQTSGFTRFTQYGVNTSGIQRNGTGQIGNRTGMMRYRPVNGEIIESGNDSVTVKLVDGSSKIVLFSDKTEINKAQKAEVSDLKVGEKVMVVGQENSDGSMTAQNIQLNPIFRGQMEISPTTTLMK